MQVVEGDSRLIDTHTTMRITIAGRRCQHHMVGVMIRRIDVSRCGPVVCWRCLVMVLSYTRYVSCDIAIVVHTLSVVRRGWEM